MKAINPYLIFNGNAEEAFTYYASIFGGKPRIVRLGDLPSGADLPAESRNGVAHVALALNGTEQVLMASDAPATDQAAIVPNPAYSVSLEVDNAEEAERIFTGLAKDGRVTMPLGKTDWAEMFAMVTDRYSVPWMIGYTGSVKLGQ